MYYVGPTRKDRKLNKLSWIKGYHRKKKQIDKGNRSMIQLYTFKNEKEVVCLNEKNCQSNSSNSDEDLSIIYRTRIIKVYSI